MSSDLLAALQNAGQKQQSASAGKSPQDDDFLKRQLHQFLTGGSQRGSAMAGGGAPPRAGQGGYVPGTSTPRGYRQPTPQGAPAGPSVGTSTPPGAGGKSAYQSPGAVTNGPQPGGAPMPGAAMSEGNPAPQAPGAVAQQQTAYAAPPVPMTYKQPGQPGPGGSPYGGTAEGRGPGAGGPGMGYTPAGTGMDTDSGTGGGMAPQAGALADRARRPLGPESRGQGAWANPRPGPGGRGPGSGEGIPRAPMQPGNSGQAAGGWTPQGGGMGRRAAGPGAGGPGMGLGQPYTPNGIGMDQDGNQGRSL